MAKKKQIVKSIGDYTTTGQELIRQINFFCEENNLTPKDITVEAHIEYGYYEGDVCPELRLEAWT